MQNTAFFQTERIFVYVPNDIHIHQPIFILNDINDELSHKRFLAKETAPSKTRCCWLLYRIVFANNFYIVFFSYVLWFLFLLYFSIVSIHFFVFIRVLLGTLYISFLLRVVFDVV